MVVPIIGFAMILVQSYLNWEIIWIKNLSIMHQYSQLEGVEDISVYRIDDQLLEKNDDIPLFYEWSGLFHYVTGNQKIIGTHYLESWAC